LQFFDLLLLRRRHDTRLTERNYLSTPHTARLCVPEEISSLRSRQRRVDRRRREALDRLVDLKGTTTAWISRRPAGECLSSRALGLGAPCVQEALGSSAGSGRWLTRTACMPNHHLLPSSRRGSRSRQPGSRGSSALIGFSARSPRKVTILMLTDHLFWFCRSVVRLSVFSFFLSYSLVPVCVVHGRGCVRRSETDPQVCTRRPQRLHPRVRPDRDGEDLHNGWFVIHAPLALRSDFGSQQNSELNLWLFFSPAVRVLF
jgi:hypothetical protein